MWPAYVMCKAKCTVWKTKEIGVLYNRAGGGGHCVVYNAAEEKFLDYQIGTTVPVASDTDVSQGIVRYLFAVVH